jgi:hypothetical protein
MPKAALLARAEADRERLIKGGDRTFDVFSRGLRAFKAADAKGAEQMYLEAVASSTVVDRMGDQITLACLEGLKSQTDGMTVWLNHDYEVPESVFGTIIEARIVPATDEGTGGLEAQGACYDLITKTLVDPDNPRAVKAWQHVQNGRRLAQSIGGAIVDYDFLDPDELWWGGLEINAMDLWEISVVGIPANQRAIIEGKAVQLWAVGLRKAKGQPFDPETKAAQRAALKRDAAPEGGEGESSVAGDESTAVDDAPGSSDAAPAAAPAETTETAPPPEQAPTPGYCSVSFNVKTNDATFTAEAVAEIIAKWFSADVAILKAPVDVEDRPQIELARKCIQDAIDHGVCGPQADSLKSASDTLTALLPESGDGEIDGDDSPAEYASAKARARSELEQLETKRAELLEQCNALVPMIKGLLDQREHLLEVVRELGLTPLHRATRPYVDVADARSLGSPDPERRKLSVSQLVNVHTKNRGADPRARSLTA